MTSYVLIDQTNGRPTANGMIMTPAILGEIAAACETQLNRDVAHSWGGSYTVRAGSSPTDIQPGEIVFALLPTLPDAPGAIAYHDVNGQGVPVIYDAISLSDTLTGSANSVSVAISHELCEATIDPGCNLWADDGAGTSHAYEGCDAVEAQTYPIDGWGTPQVSVSNFLLPSFFISNHAGPYDYLSSVGSNPGAPTAPFQTTAGGYQIERTAGTDEHQAQGFEVTVSATIPFGHRMRRPWHHGSRRARRGVVKTTLHTVDTGDEPTTKP